MSTKKYKQYQVYLRPEHIEWARKQAQRSKISVSHLERILKDNQKYINIDALIKEYAKD